MLLCCRTHGCQQSLPLALGRHVCSPPSLLEVSRQLPCCRYPRTHGPASKQCLFVGILSNACRDSAHLHREDGMYMSSVHAHLCFSAFINSLARAMMSCFVSYRCRQISPDVFGTNGADNGPKSASPNADLMKSGTVLYNKTTVPEQVHGLEHSCI